MTTPTAAELVEAVTPILPLPGLDGFVAYRHDSNTEDDGVVVVDHSWMEGPRDMEFGEHISLESAARLTIGAIVEECERRGWILQIDGFSDPLIVSVRTGPKYEQRHNENGSVVIAACRAMRRAIEASRGQA